jgi:very-short-patch-repair endonuclease
VLTVAGQLIWAGVRNHGLGVHIRRQQALLHRYVIDFNCARARLCIEIDGDSHMDPDQAEYDAACTAHLEAQGYRVIRFTNSDVLKNHHTVLEAICDACLAPSLPSP